MRRRCGWVLVSGALSTGCIDLSRVHVGTEITDPRDPSHIDLSKGSHPLSPWFEYEVRGWAGDRSLAFHLEEDGRRQTLGAMPVDGWLTSVNQREAAYAISEDGRTL